MLRNKLLFLSGFIVFYTSVVSANDSDINTVESFISKNTGAVIYYLESYNTSNWSEEEVRHFMELTNKKWDLIKSEIVPVKDGETPFWCGLRSLL